MFVILFLSGIGAKVFALLIFSAASLTDFFDGYIARKHKLVTNFGKLLDPIADKLLVLGAFITFVELRVVAAWMVVLIVSREIIITSLRLFAVTKGKVLAAEKGGKHKTVSQMVAIFVILGCLIIRELLVSARSWTPRLERLFDMGIFLLMLITITLTLTSGISYLWRNRKLTDD